MIKRIYLEITDACNLNCPFCTNEKGHSFLSFAEIERYIQEIKEITPYIYLHVLGEPLLHPDFSRILNLLDKEAMQLQLVTNGTLLGKYPDLLRHSCLRKLAISLHSVNDLKVANDYFETIDQLIEAERNCALELRFYNPAQLKPQLAAYLAHLKAKYPPKETTKSGSLLIKEKTYLYFAEFFRWPMISDPFISDKGQCLGGKNMLAILHNGDVTLCCLDPKGHNALGNLKEKSLKQILASDLYQNYLKELKENHLIFKLCQNCSYRQRFDGKNN